MLKEPNPTSLSYPNSSGGTAYENRQNLALYAHFTLVKKSTNVGIIWHLLTLNA